MDSRACAKAAGLTLVTNNEREFRRIQGLKIQNWAELSGPSGPRSSDEATAEDRTQWPREQSLLQRNNLNAFMSHPKPIDLIHKPVGRHVAIR